MSDVADTGQCFATKTIGPDCAQILESLKLGGCKPFAKDRKIVSLEVKSVEAVQFGGKGREIR